MTLLYSVICLTALLGISSLAIDVGRVQVAKMQLERAAGAAVRYAAKGLYDSTATAKAISAANDNSADGTNLNIGTSDVQTGYWNSSTKTFTAGGTQKNAVRVVASRTGTAGIPTLFAQALGRTRCSVTAIAIATGTPRLPAFSGINGITMKNNNYIGSYNSTTTTSPSPTNSTGKGALGTNGNLTGGNNDTLAGNVILGPSATVSGVSVTGSQVSSSTALTPPSDPAWSPGTNPGSISQSYTVNSDTVLAGGTYWFTSLTLNANLSFSGPAIVYVNGNIVISGALTASGSVPANLTIYQIGSGHTFGDTGANNINICACVYAPNVDFSIKNNLDFEGSGVFNTITVKNNANFYFDETMGSADGGIDVTMVN